MSDPAAAHLWDAWPVGSPGKVTTLLLTSIGRKSGTPRHVPLLYVDSGEGYLIIGSKGGKVDHPIWNLNLQADPHVRSAFRRCTTALTPARSKAPSAQTPWPGSSTVTRPPPNIRLAPIARYHLCSSSPSLAERAVRRTGLPSASWARQLILTLEFTASLPSPLPRYWLIAAPRGFKPLEGHRTYHHSFLWITAATLHRRHTSSPPHER